MELDFRVETLQARIDAALNLKIPVHPESTINFNGVPTKIEDLPTASDRAMQGYGHYNPFSRPVNERPDGKQWMYTPNMCLVAGDHTNWVWVDSEHLSCPGCGIDGT